MGKWFPVWFVLAVVLGLTTGCGNSASPTTTTGRVLAAAPSLCPRTATTVHPVPLRPGLADQLVPSGPVRAAVCRYEGLDGPAAAGSLVRSHVVSGPALDDLVALFNSPQWQVITDPAVYSCPFDEGAVDDVWFMYTAGPSVVVSVDLAGCRFASNGVRTIAGNTLVQRLATLVGSSTS